MSKSSSLSRLWAEFRPRTFETLPSAGFETLLKDSLAGITVGIVAIPLALAFAIASGVAPEKGLITAIIAGFIISFLGGSRTQIGGPTGAFVVVLYGVVERHGYEGLVLATLIAGLLLVLLGAFRLGSYIKYIPYPVIIGFTTGIAIIIFSSQVKDFFGLNIAKLPADFLGKWELYGQNAFSFDLTTTLIGALTLTVLICLRQLKLPIPPAIFAIAIATLLVWLTGSPVETIETRFGGIPNTLPTPHLPSFTWEQVRAVFPDAITIALLGGIESLLSALVADGMTGDKHKSNTELVGQGIANVASALFGGIAATGAIARTGVNIRSGAQTPWAGMMHALFLLAVLLLLAPIAAKIPLAALAAVLFLVSWDMSERHHVRELLRAPRSDVLLLLTTLTLTVLVDLTVAVQVGVVMAALLFMKRMSDVSHLRLSSLEDVSLDLPDAATLELPQGVRILEMQGPFFFGVSDQIDNHLPDILESKPRTVILNLTHVPTIDASGLAALKKLAQRLAKAHISMVIVTPRASVLGTLTRMKIPTLIGEKNLYPTLPEALAAIQ